MKRSTTIKSVIKLLSADSKNPLRNLVLYGSGKNDIDMLAIYKYQPISINISLGILDIIAVGYDKFIELLELYDPLITEPILTGQCCYGDTNEMENFKDFLVNSKPTIDSIFYLIDQSIKILNDAVGYLNLVQHNNNCSLYEDFFWKNLSFSASYISYAKEYRNGNYPLVFQDILNGNHLSSDILINLKNEDSRKKLTLENKREYIKKVKIEMGVKRKRW